MALVEDRPAGDAGDAVFGDGFEWCADESVPRRFNPVTDIAYTDQPVVGAEWMQAVVEHCAQGLALLESVDPTGFDAATVTAWTTGIEQLRRQAEAASIAAADHVEVAQPFRAQGFFTAKAWLKHRLHLSGSEAFGWVQAAKLRRAAPVWNNALGAGQVGVAQTRLMARIAANPRIPADVLTDGVWQLMIDAMDLPYSEFEQRALTWEALADPIGAADQAERNRQRRTASMRQTPDGAWDLHASFDDVGGVEFLEIFSWYTDREFQRDWTDAIERLGDGNVDISTLRRTEAQRRSDALLEMARAAAACPPDRQRPLPTVNFLLDENTAAAIADHDPLDPANYRNVTARTSRGHRVDPNAIIGVSMWSLIRRVVTNTPGVVIEMGRTTRLFTGAARDAVMLLEPTCIWPGCDHPHTWCHADHLTSWSTRGPTNPDNGAPLCPRHNYLKEAGFTIHRDDDGHWHIIGPDGTEIS